LLYSQRYIKLNIYSWLSVKSIIKPGVTVSRPLYNQMQIIILNTNLLVIYVFHYKI